MTKQLINPFEYDKKPFVLLGAEDPYALFDPERYGFHPTSFATNCWNGFSLHFRVIDNILYLQHFHVYCGDGNYPALNGVTTEEKDEHGMMFYRDVHLRMHYTGKITIGFSLLSFLKGVTYDDFEEAYELTFTDGVLTEREDITGNFV